MCVCVCVCVCSDPSQCLSICPFVCRSLSLSLSLSPSLSVTQCVCVCVCVRVCCVSRLSPTLYLSVSNPIRADLCVAVPQSVSVAILTVCLCSLYSLSYPTSDHFEFAHPCHGRYSRPSETCHCAEGEVSQKGVFLVPLQHLQPLLPFSSPKYFNCNRGNEALGKGNFASAVAFYTEGIAIQSGNNIALLTNRALAHLKLPQFEAAAADCDQVLETDQLNLKALMRRGKAMRELGKFEV